MMALSVAFLPSRDGVHARPEMNRVPARSNVDGGVALLREKCKEIAHRVRKDLRRKGDQGWAAHSHPFAGGVGITAAVTRSSGEKSPAPGCELERGKRTWR